MNFFRWQQRKDEDLNTEIQNHLDEAIRERMERGESAKQARLNAQREFGNVGLVKEVTRAMWGWAALERLWQDLRFGVRMLRKQPGFTLIAILTLALGIGANTAIFSVVNALLLQSLPYQNPEQLVWLTEVVRQPPRDLIIGSHFLAWREQSQTLAQLAAYAPWNMTLSGAGEPERLDVNQVSTTFLELFGVKLLLGRNFLTSEGQPGGARAAILSHSLWQRRFSADPQIIGRSITLDDRSYVVTGVLPPDFRFFQRFDVWVPLTRNLSDHLTFFPHALARLKPGITPEQAKAELETINRRLIAAEAPSQSYDSLRLDGQMRLMSLHEKLVGRTQRPLLILLGAVTLILLIACANVANLLLARAAVRQKEFAVRAALGAGRGRLMRQMLAESWLLALAGGGLGLCLAFWLTKALTALAAADTFGDIAHQTTINLDFRVLGFTLLVSLLTGTLFGLAPAFQYAQPNLQDSLKEGGRGGGIQRTRLQRALMVTEVALAVVLLVGAGLLIRSFVKLLEINPGYQSDNLLTLRVALPRQRYEKNARRAAFYEELLQRIATLPGVASVGLINHLPLNEIELQGWMRIPGQPQFLNVDQPGIPMGHVSEDYFRAMGIPLREGRFFTAHDHAESARVAILSEALARQLFPQQDALGKQIWLPGPGEDLATVIGIVGDIRHKGLERDVTPQIYLPFRYFAPWSNTLVVRAASDPLQLTTAVRHQVLAIDGTAPVYDVRTMEQRLSGSLAARRFNLLLLGGFGFLALALATVGVYSVLTYVVTQRTHEIGIRLALGATAADVLRLLLGQGMKLVALGMVFGLMGARALTHVMTSLLFGISATDSFTFAAVASLLALAALLACWLPARRATKVDPLIALRHE